jgi:N-acetylmuramoyl-L-alanine amidase
VAARTQRVAATANATAVELAAVSGRQRIGRFDVSKGRRPGRPFLASCQSFRWTGWTGRFGILLDVGNKVRDAIPAFIRIRATLRLGLLGGALACAGAALSDSTGTEAQTAAQGQATAPAAQAPVPATTPAPGGIAAGTATPAQRPAPNIVVLDPAHGGTDLGARGTGGVRESEIVLEFATQVRAALESQGFQVIQTRQGNENPSFDDRSAIANAQRGAVFVTLHVASTGLPGTARVYVMSDLPASDDVTGLIPWDRAQAPFLPLSRKLGDLVQGLLAQRFKGSPGVAQTAALRQLRTTAAPAIAVEVSSVSVEDRGELDRMAPGVADAIARGAAAFRPSYVVAANPGDRP